MLLQVDEARPVPNESTGASSADAVPEQSALQLVEESIPSKERLRLINGYLTHFDEMNKKLTSCFGLCEPCNRDLWRYTREMALFGAPSIHREVRTANRHDLLSSIRTADWCRRC